MLVNGKEKPHRNHLNARQLPFCHMVIGEKVNHLLCAFPLSAGSVMGRSRSSGLGCERRGLHLVLSETALA